MAIKRKKASVGAPKTTARKTVKKSASKKVAARPSSAHKAHAKKAAEGALMKFFHGIEDLFISHTKPAKKRATKAKKVAKKRRA